MNFLKQMSSETTTKWICNIKKNLTSRFSYSRWDSRGGSRVAHIKQNISSTHLPLIMTLKHAVSPKRQEHRNSSKCNHVQKCFPRNTITGRQRYLSAASRQTHRYSLISPEKQMIAQHLLLLSGRGWGDIFCIMHERHDIFPNHSQNK